MSLRMRGSRLVGALVVLVAGCGGAPPPAVTASEPAAPVEATTAGEPELADGVVALGPLCAPGAEERCDGLDSDCDGALDEGCEGATPGPMQVAVAWTGRAGLSVAVDGPEDASLAVEGPCPANGGVPVLRGSAERVSPGRYRVTLRYAATCEGAEPTPVTATVSLSVLGRTYGPFNRTVEPDASAPLLDLELR